MEDSTDTNYKESKRDQASLTGCKIIMFIIISFFIFAVVFIITVYNSFTDAIKAFFGA